MARTKEEQREYDRERKRKQRKELWLRPTEESYRVTSRQITVSSSAKFALEQMAKLMECTMSEVLSALGHLDNVFRDANFAKEPVLCAHELFEKAINLDREAAKRSAERMQKTRESLALLKTYKKEEL